MRCPAGTCCDGGTGCSAAGCSGGDAVMEIEMLMNLEEVVEVVVAAAVSRSLLEAWRLWW